MQDLKMAPAPCCEKPKDLPAKEGWHPLLQAFVAVVLLAGARVLYKKLDAIAGWLAGSVLGLDLHSRFGEAVRFFLYDTPKVLLLLVVVVFFVGVVRTWFTPEATRKYLAGKRESAGNVLASLLGVLTPFCSCSAVPLFVGFVTAGVPLGVTFSFLIASPMVNEVALALLAGMFGWKLALLYMGTGLLVAVVAGWIIGRMGMERHLQDWVGNQLSVMEAPSRRKPTWSERFAEGRIAVREIVGKVWLWVVLGIAVGAGIHGYVPEDFMAGLMGRGAWWSVPLAVLIGVPMYSNAAGIIPILQALIAKGAALGTALAFMMSVIALSLPEMLILRKVLKLRLILVFAGVVAAGILLVGFLFNMVL